MAAQQPLQSKPNAARHAKAFNGLVGIARTRRFEAATSREQDRQIRFVETQREQRRANRNGSVFYLCRGDLRGGDLRRSGLPSALIAGVHGRNSRRTRGRPYALFSRRNKSAVSAANGARATELFGCMTMSHPAGISSRWQRTTSRRRRRIRLRTTAPPRAFLMLKPKRLCGRLFAFTKAVKWELERRFPARYTASNCAFCTSRASRGYFCPDLLGRKAMASLLAASRQDFPAAYGLHARAKSVRFGAAALARLICALWQSNPPIEV